MISDLTVVTHDPAKHLVSVSFTAPLDPAQEMFLCEYLTKAPGVLYMEHHEDTMRLAGYGVDDREWEQFRFWLGVSIYTALERSDGEK